MKTQIKADFTDVFAKLNGLEQAAKEHLPRSMAVAGGTVIRDEAKARAPVFDGSTALTSGKNKDRPPVPGLLRDAIYLAFADKRSALSIGLATYSVAWNAAKAPHGHLIEFGHWRINKIMKDKDGNWHPTKERLSAPKWVPAVPFLRPAYEAVGQRAVQAMLDRGQVRLAEIMANPESLKAYK
ncbi:HK97 gp10 family phage protein [Kerstersia gyiorum]|uniref:HK97 gp10 family phage protein n=1 Tax=Kerstersia gyiorum TaxID=206506 RepID=A0A171KSH2_9BURK|nr:HK97 gp10 family phage protein [Kerstersia gyiorum]KKO71839.1 hypothetical protein AAV32_09710 [Kerstersia gyiorum]